MFEILLSDARLYYMCYDYVHLRVFIFVFIVGGFDLCMLSLKTEINTVSCS